jgi:signal recognition particle receptor subunit beta
MLDGVERKSTTTVALTSAGSLSEEPGRLPVRDAGPERFWFMWDELARGALGAVVLADTWRLADCFLR